MLRNLYIIKLVEQLSVQSSTQGRVAVMGEEEKEHMEGMWGV